MEREPEENDYSENGKEGVHPLFDFLRHCGLFLCGVFHALHGFLLRWSRESLLRTDENHKGNEHRGN